MTAIQKIALLLALLIALSAPTALAHTRDEVRQAWNAVPDPAAGSPYAEVPSPAAPYASGALTEAAKAEALNLLNFARWLAGLDAVTESAIYDYQCQHGAVLLAALDYVDHNAPMPEDMDRNFYDSAHLATTSGSIARFNWMRDTILREGVEYFLRDDGEANLSTLGHRRWALDPLMAATGFGLANSQSGMSYVVMYAHDLGNPDAAWDSVCWPAAGSFPAELMHDHLAWSVTLNPAAYDLQALDPTVTLSEASGLRFRFRPAEGTGDGFCALNADGYGAGPCLIFRPEFTGTGFTDYQQNQLWTVRVDGLADAQGAPRSLEYQVRMISLTVQDVFNVEVTPRDARLSPGDALQLSAAVVPVYADDLDLAWHSTDPSVATVDDSGRVTAVAPGACAIVAASANGCTDMCKITVEVVPKSLPLWGRWHGEAVTDEVAPHQQN
ncbi:MAG: Ig-like domain-containing protein [Clostridia bacterium]|nr:Ig-like domain-containing protein [Clostridia bacterium]